MKFDRFFMISLVMILMLIVLTPQVSAFRWCDWIPFWDCNDPIELVDYTQQYPDGSCGGERFNFEVNITPCIAVSPIGRNLKHDVTFTYSGLNNKNGSLVFIYSGELEYAKFELERTKKENKSVYSREEVIEIQTINNITDYTNLGNVTNVTICDKGTLNNSKVWEVEINNSQTYNICFENKTVIDGDTIDFNGYYMKDVTELVEVDVKYYVDVSENIDFLGNNLNDQGYSYYEVQEFKFVPNRTYNTRWTYTPKDKERNGKWSIIAYESELGLMNSIENDKYLFLDPWWNNAFQSKYNLTNWTGEYPTLNLSKTNITSCDDTFEDIRFIMNDTLELNYTIRANSSSDWVYVTVDTNNDTEGTLWLYCNNNTPVSTTSSGSDTFKGSQLTYGFDDNLARDLSNGYDGTLNGSTAATDGYMGRAMDLDGTNSFIDTLYQMSAVDDYTVALWINPDVTGNGDYIVSTFTTADHINLLFTTNNDLLPREERNNLGDKSAVTSGSFDTGTWYYVVMVSDRNDKLYIYVNGAENNSVVNSDAQLTPPGSFFLGVQNNPTGTPQSGTYYNGKVDEVSIYTRAISPDEVSDLYSMSDQTATVPVGAEESVNEPVTVNLISPANDTTVNSNGYTASFIATVYDPDTDIDNCTLNVWNLSTDVLTYTQTNTSIINNTNVTFVQVLMASNYSWNVDCIDNQSRESSNATNWTINVIPVPDSAPTVTLNSPTNNTNYTSSPADITFNCSASDDSKLDNVSLYIDNVLNLTNSSGVNDTYYIFTPSSFGEGVYDWSCGAVDNASQETRPTALDFIVDYSIPLINITSPPNGTVVTEFNETLTLNWTVSDPTLQQCWYNGANITMSDSELDITSPPLGTGLSNDFYTFYNNSKGTSGDFDTNTVFPSNGAEISSNSGNAVGWSMPLPSPNCYTANYTTKPGFKLEDHSNKYFCMQDQFDRIVLFKIINITSLNGSYYGDFVTCGDNTTTFNYPLDNPDNLLITFLSNDILNNIGNDSITILKSQDAPDINITSPVDNYGRLDTGDSIDLNFTITNITELDTCIYEYNSVNTTLPCDSTITENFSYFGGANTLTVYVNDTLSNLNSSSVTWTIDFAQNSQSYSNITTEGATETFNINFTLRSGIQTSVVYLVYNETFYSFPYSVDANNTVFAESTIVIPPVAADVNLSFYWNITLDDGTSVTSVTNNQTVLNIDIDNCTTYNNTLYNITQYEERTKELMDNNTVELQINIYDSSKSQLFINFSQIFNDTNPVQVCLGDALLPNVSYSSYVVIKYYAENYSIEYYNTLNETISNTTIPKNVTLYSLNEDETTQFQLTFRDQFYNLAEDILVNVYRQYLEDNDFKVVEVPLTDSNGQTILNLVRNDIVYNFVMIDELGEIIATFNNVKVFCQDYTIGECTLNLAPPSAADEMYNYEEEFNIYISSPTYDNSTELISIEFVTDDLEPVTVRMDVVRNNDFGNRSVCTNSLLSASGTLSCNVSSVVDTDQFLFISIYVSNSIAREDTINLNASTISFGILNGAFFAFIIFLLLICLFMEDRRVLTVSLGIGWIVVISLGLVNGKLVGFGTAGIWLLITIAIFIWKLNKEDVR